MALNVTLPNFVAGTVVSEADLDALSNGLNGIQAAWDAFTPALVGITLGNGTLEGRWIRVGKTIHYKIKLIAGSTTTFSATTLVFGLPVAPHASYLIDDVMGSANLYDASVGSASRAGATACNSGGSGVFLLADRLATQATVTNLVPWTWAVSDKIAITGTYEAA